MLKVRYFIIEKQKKPAYLEVVYKLKSLTIY